MLGSRGACCECRHKSNVRGSKVKFAQCSDVGQLLLNGIFTH